MNISSPILTDVRRNLSEAFLRRACLCAVAWLTLTLGNLESLWLGVPVIVLSAYFSVKISPLLNIHWPALFKWFNYFLINSVKGAIDVSCRVLARNMPISPEIVEYSFESTSTFKTVMMVNTISLLPGTLGAKIVGDKIFIHVLNYHKDIKKDIQEIENLVDQITTGTLNSNGE